MSYTRAGTPGKYADGADHLYAYPSGSGDGVAITIAGRGAIGYAEWAEVTGRIMQRHIDDDALISAAVDAILTEGERWGDADE